MFYVEVDKIFSWQQVGKTKFLNDEEEYMFNKYGYQLPMFLLYTFWTFLDEIEINYLAYIFNQFLPWQEAYFL